MTRPYASFQSHVQVMDWLAARLLLEKLHWRPCVWTITSMPVTIDGRAVAPVMGMGTEASSPPPVTRSLWYRSQKGVPTSGNCSARIWFSHSMIDPDPRQGLSSGLLAWAVGTLGWTAPAGGPSPQLKSQPEKCGTPMRQNEAPAW